jgi:3-hydroxyisobutyrate dehydrogenase
VSDRLTAAVLELMEVAAGRLPDPAAVDVAALVEGMATER